MIELKSICKTYKPGLFKKKVRAVQGLSFSVRQGEVYGLIGPNGAGKSTTIRMMLGLIRPDSGRVLFGGKPLGESDFRRQVGYLPENPYLYDHLSLTELLRFCGCSSGMEASAVQKRSFELMERLHLLDAQKRPLRTFSKGMLQRAGICFALLHDPSVVILDEPMSGLDPIGRKMVYDLVVDLKQQRKTVFFCSHILNDVERLCDRIGMLVQGELVEEFLRDDLVAARGEEIYLRVEPMTELLLDNLKGLGVEARLMDAEFLLAVPRERLSEVNSVLGEAGVGVLGGRSEWVTLEELFIEAVEGGR